jgi:hypothetical protein
VGKSRSRARAAAQGQKQAKRAIHTKGEKSQPNKKSGSPPSNKQEWPTPVRISAWIIAMVLAVAVPSYILYRVDRAQQEPETGTQNLFTDISSIFSYGFNQKDIASGVSFQDAQAMTITWSRNSAHSIEVDYKLGFYAVQNPDTTARLVAMVPVSAQLVSCSYDDLNLHQATGAPGVSFAPARKAHCTMKRSQYAKFYSTTLVPNTDPDGTYVTNLTFLWNSALITHLGVGRDAIHLQYQGKFSTDPAGSFFPADATTVKYDSSKSDDQSALPHGVYLKYQNGASEDITDAAPIPATTSEDTQIWVSSSAMPTYSITLITEDTNTRTLFELLQQGIFLVVGAVIGAAVPHLRRRRKSE